MSVLAKKKERRRTLLKELEKLEKEIAALQKQSATGAEIIKALGVSNEYAYAISWSSFFQKYNPQYVVEVILDRFEENRRNIAFATRALFLVCAFEEQEVALDFVGEMYNEYNKKTFYKIVLGAIILVSEEKNKRNYLPNYHGVVVAFVAYFGDEAPDIFPSHADIFYGYVIAEMYRQGHKIENIPLNERDPLFSIYDIIKDSPTPLSQTQIRDLAIYTLRTVDLRREYDRILNKDFHCYLFLNANVEGVLPENKDVRDYLETLGHCEEDV